MPDLSIAALIAMDPRSGAPTSLKAPPNLPTGVLAPETMTASFMIFPPTSQLQIKLYLSRAEWLYQFSIIFIYDSIVIFMHCI
jgi:hypothetical protein